MIRSCFIGITARHFSPIFRFDLIDTIRSINLAYNRRRRQLANVKAIDRCEHLCSFLFAFTSWWTLMVDAFGVRFRGR